MKDSGPFCARLMGFCAEPASDATAYEEKLGKHGFALRAVAHRHPLGPWNRGSAPE